MSRLLNITKWYIPIIRRPRITINEAFMKKLRSDENDDSSIRKTKDELFKFFKQYHGSRYPNLLTRHVLLGTITRSV